ncbi:MAG: 30S ribosomal protein S6 [Clostridiaceae bacterium]|jgi:small subunit ribosomal protein S6|nr:30S ribosomal protein S6 [Clostridia bacterium]MBP6161529.1 30S ribosomal protein S6 [Clostridia bacterium]MBP6949841.1 30S ribosomal protein S6 [Clostridia bacterium]NMA36233.1 30S ribosomal protein S6 [Clostridiaceae bacterium]
MTKKYELIYVLNGTLRADELRAQMERVHGIVEASGEIVDIVEWGRRRLAYEIQDIREGYYVLVYFNAAPDAPREIERLLRIYDAVLRFLIVVAEGDFVPTKRTLAEEESDEKATEDVDDSEISEVETEDATESESVAEAETETEVEVVAEPEEEVVAEVESDEEAPAEQSEEVVLEEEPVEEN